MINKCGLRPSPSENPEDHHRHFEEGRGGGTSPEEQALGERRESNKEGKRGEAEGEGAGGGGPGPLCSLHHGPKPELRECRLRRPLHSHWLRLPPMFTELTVLKTDSLLSFDYF